MEKNFFLLLLTVPMCITIESEDRGMFEAGNNMIEPRIIGGHYIDITEAPYMVSIQVLVPKREHFCGGSILTPSVILTAAHCLYLEKKELWVNAGTTSWSGDGELIKINRHIIHEYYSSASGAHDVAVALLEKRLPIDPLGGYVGDKIRTLALSPLNENPGSVYAFATGWGYDTCPGPTTINLKGLAVIANLDEDCIKLNSIEFIEGDHLCAGNVGRPTDEIWKGDSGGPLVHGDAQIGIVSKSKCKLNHPNYVAIYTSVIHHRTWIVNKTGELARDLKQLEDNFKYFNKKLPSLQNPFILT